MKRLSTKIALILLLLFCMIGLVFFLISRHLIDRNMLEVTQRLNRPLADYVVSNWLQNSALPPRETLEEIFLQLMLVNPAVELYLLDAEGEILAYSADPRKIKRIRVDTRPLERYLERDSNMPVFGDDPRDPNRRKIFSAARMPDQDGYLYVVLGGEKFDQLQRELRASYLPRLGALAAFLSLLFAVLAGLCIYVVLTRRLSRLALAMDSFRRLEFSHLGPVANLRAQATGDEIDRLTATFKQMAARIIKLVSMLRETDASRRRLVATVAHDLRTPMASLHGYLETLLVKTGELDESERERCVQTALKASERLSRLANELFELARLDIHDEALEVEPFNIGELAHDIVQEFKFAAAERGISLDGQFNGALPMVEGNIGLIQRVFVNLIDNAVRHTPAGGEVTVELTHVEGAVEVAITDSGRGIPVNELTRIFDPLYRVKRGRQAADDGHGLGLAIVKRILELHGSDITATNVPGGGMRFVFHMHEIAGATVKVP